MYLLQLCRCEIEHKYELASCMQSSSSEAKIVTPTNEPLPLALHPQNNYSLLPIHILQIPMEMPSRRPHSYINSFSAIEYTVVEGLAGPLHKAKSNKELSTSQPAECSYRYSRSNSQGADFQQAVSTSPKDEQFDLQREAALEELREQLEQIPFKKKYASVTVPLAIRYSTMASRPRSPKKNNELAEQLEQEKLQEELDQSLLKIKEQLVSLCSLYVLWLAICCQNSTNFSNVAAFMQM